MDLAGEDFLTRTVLARDEDVCVRGSNLLHLQQQLAHRLAIAPIRCRLCPTLLAFSLCRMRTVGVCITERGDHLGIVERLDDEVHGTFLQPRHSKVNVGVSGEEHHPHLWLLLFDLPKPVEALVTIVDAAAKVHVEEYDIRLQRPQTRWGVCRIGDALHRFKHVTHQQSHRREHVAVVVDDQQFSLFLLHIDEQS